MPTRRIAPFPLLLIGLIACLLYALAPANPTPIYLTGASSISPVFVVLGYKAPFLVFLVLCVLSLRQPPLVVWGSRVAALFCLFSVGAQAFSAGFQELLFSNEALFDRYLDFYYDIDMLGGALGIAFAAGMLLFCAAFVRSPYKPLRVCAKIAALGRTLAMILVLARSFFFDLSFELTNASDIYFILTEFLTPLADLSLAALFIGLLLWLYHEGPEFSPF